MQSAFLITIVIAMSTTATRFPLDPLLDHLNVEAHGSTENQYARSLKWFQAWASFNGGAMKTACQHGLSDRQADRLAVRAGLHPGLLWPEHWWASAPDDDELVST